MFDRDHQEIRVPLDAIAEPVLQGLGIAKVPVAPRVAPGTAMWGTFISRSTYPDRWRGVKPGYNASLRSVKRGRTMTRALRIPSSAALRRAARPVLAPMAAVLLLLLPWLTSCESKRGIAEGAVFSFLSAVQLEDHDALYCLLYGASEIEGGPDVVAARREAFDAWVRARYEAYITGRDAGRLDLGDDGIVLAKALALGKGTYYTLRSVRQDGDSLDVVMDVTLAYPEINIADLPPRTTFYVCTLPVGEIRPVRIPTGTADFTLEVLDTLAVRWTLVRAEATASCPEGWAVADVTPLDETATTTEVTWEFGYF